ncbi:MAG: hypothetical protein AUG96_01990 [Chloroflexi bacterium 13_1_20CM_4_66_15]|nr:MAG: hypothetical protein AUG96_01990 [Chloroflexi bacterium 13_1_20CM_4_66_15]
MSGIKSEAMSAIDASATAIRNVSCRVVASALRMACIAWSKSGASWGVSLALAAAIFAGSRRAFGLLAESPMAVLNAGGRLTRLS